MFSSTLNTVSRVWRPAHQIVTAVLFPQQAVDLIDEHAKTWPVDRERGGILLGLRKLDAIEIVTVTFPSAWDFCTPTLFKRSPRVHRIRALREWITSKKKIDWIGEWHTHPAGSSQPSQTDRNSWKKVANHTGKEMVFVIFGQSSMSISIQRPSSKSILSLAEQESDGENRLFA